MDEGIDVEDMDDGDVEDRCHSLLDQGDGVVVPFYQFRPWIAFRGEVFWFLPLCSSYPRFDHTRFKYSTKGEGGVVHKIVGMDVYAHTTCRLLLWNVLRGWFLSHLIFSSYGRLLWCPLSWFWPGKYVFNQCSKYPSSFRNGEIKKRGRVCAINSENPMTIEQKQGIESVAKWDHHH